MSNCIWLIVTSYEIPEDQLSPGEDPFFTHYGGGLCVGVDGLILTVYHIARLGNLPHDQLTFEGRYFNYPMQETLVPLELVKYSINLDLALFRPKSDGPFEFYHLNNEVEVDINEPVFSFVHQSDLFFSQTFGITSYPFPRNTPIPHLLDKQTLLSVGFTDRHSSIDQPYRTLDTVAQKNDLDFFDLHPKLPFIQVCGMDGMKGSSGCPVFKDKGEFIGIVCMTKDSFSYIIPVNLLSVFVLDYEKNNDSARKQTTSFLLKSSKSGLSGGLSARTATKCVIKTNNLELSEGQTLTPLPQESNNVQETIGVTTRGVIVGLTGLLNLGNTCFMNSAIQCLVHTPEFANYFREDYRGEINWQNPKGMVGELALEFGELLRKLWAPGRTPVAPRPFKAKISRFAPQFSGYNQHDSQELLAALLDGLHEDLNRVKDKPYVQSRDADGRPDEEVADEYWANHKACNDSIIVDVCQGQYKSTLVCHVCAKISVTFDPFMHLSLPLQSTVTRTLTVTIFSSDGSLPPNICTVTVPKQGRCRDLIQALSAACSLKINEKLLLAEIQNHLIHRFLEDPLTLLSSIKDDDHLAAYKIPLRTKGTIFLQLIHRHEENETTTSQKSKRWKPYGTPLVSLISCKDGTMRGDVQSMVRTMLSPLLKAECKEQIHLPVDDVSSAVQPSSAGVRGHEDLSAPKEMNIETSSPQTLPLQLINEPNACIDLTWGEGKPVKISSSSKSLLVSFNWSKELLKKYDTSYLENLPEVFKNGAPAKKALTEPLSLYSCLEAFLREGPLVSESDMWKCPQCEQRRHASKKLDLWRLPEVLVIHLKRFSYNRSLQHKLDLFVNFPIHDLDLSKCVANKNVSEPQLYELYAVINHYGSMGSGHYTTHIKLLDEIRWYNFDDSHIIAINEDEVKTNAAYVLFYRRKKENSDNNN